MGWMFHLGLNIGWRTFRGAFRSDRLSRGDCGNLRRLAGVIATKNTRNSSSL